MSSLATRYAEIEVPAARLRTLNSDPFEVLPAPGIGYVYAYRSIESFLRIPTTPYPITTFTGTQLKYGPTVPNNTQEIFVDGLASLMRATAPSLSASHSPDPTVSPLAKYLNKEILLLCDEDADTFGGVLTSSVGNAGTDYEIGDIFTSDGPVPANGGFTGEVATVDMAGAVLTYTISGPGNGFQAGLSYETNTDSALGTGFTLHVVTITPNAGDAILSLRVGYAVLAVPTS